MIILGLKFFFGLNLIDLPLFGVWQCMIMSLKQKLKQNVHFAIYEQGTCIFTDVLLFKQILT